MLFRHRILFFFTFLVQLQILGQTDTTITDITGYEDGYGTTRLLLTITAPAAYDERGIVNEFNTLSFNEKLIYESVFIWIMGDYQYEQINDVMSTSEEIPSCLISTEAWVMTWGIINSNDSLKISNRQYAFSRLFQSGYSSNIYSLLRDIHPTYTDTGYIWKTHGYIKSTDYGNT